MPREAERDMPAYDVAAYIMKLRITNTPVLLVEGSNDKRAFLRLLEHFNHSQVGTITNKLVIDTAEMLKSPPPGNRAKVETVCANLGANEDFNHFVAFVDRELREFSVDELEDAIGDHRVVGRLVWSRGHSMENYFFDPEVFREAALSTTVIDGFAEAIDAYRANFHSALRIACSVSLAALEHDALRYAAGAIHMDVVSNGEVGAILDVERWEINLLKSTRSNRELVSSIVESFEIWERRLAEADLEFLRWMSHGHIGLTVLWKVLCMCLLNMDPRERQALTRAGEEAVRSNVQEKWARRAAAAEAFYPDIVFSMLGISSSHPSP
jgi:hypothetical protein